MGSYFRTRHFYSVTNVISLTHNPNPFLHRITSLIAGPDQGAYRHEMFQRGNKELCLGMKRTKQKGSPQLKPSPRITSPPGSISRSSPISMSSSPPFALDGRISPAAPSGVGSFNSHAPQVAFSAPSTTGSGAYFDRGMYHPSPYGQPPHHHASFRTQQGPPTTAIGMLGGMPRNTPTTNPNNNALLSNSMNARNAINFQVRTSDEQRTNGAKLRHST